MTKKLYALAAILILSGAVFAQAPPPFDTLPTRPPTGQWEIGMLPGFPVIVFGPDGDAVYAVNPQGYVYAKGVVGTNGDPNQATRVGFSLAGQAAGTWLTVRDSDGKLYITADPDAVPSDDDEVITRRDLKAHIEGILAASAAVNAAARSNR